MQNTKDKSDKKEQKGLIQKTKHVPLKIRLKRGLKKMHQHWNKFSPYLINVLEFVLIYISILSAIFLTVFLQFQRYTHQQRVYEYYLQSFLPFVICGSLLVLMYLSHLIIFYIYRDTIKTLILGEDPEPEPEEAPPEPEGMFAPVVSFCRSFSSILKKGCKLLWKGLKVFLFCLASIVMLDLPVWFYHVRYKKLFESEYNQILAFILGWIAILTFIPVFLINTIYIIYAQYLNPFFIFDKSTLDIALGFSLLFTLFGAAVGMFHVQFFDTKKSTFLQQSIYGLFMILIRSTLWGLMRSSELLSKSLLIAIFFHYNKESSMAPFIAFGVFYVVYAIFCTLIFPCYNEQFPTTFFEKVKYVLKAYMVNQFCRLLAFPYKETPLLFSSLTFYNDKKEEIAPEGWRNLMHFRCEVTKVKGMSRRRYTHIVQCLRTLQNFNLILFALSLDIINKSLYEYVDLQVTQLYYISKPISIMLTFFMFVYYVSCGFRTLYFPQYDISGVDE